MKARQIYIGIGCSLTLVILLSIVKYFQITSAMAGAENQGPPPEAVTSFTVEKQSWTRTLAAVGSVRPVLGTMLSAEESGRIANVRIESGSSVKRGELLVALDTRVERAEKEGIVAQLELAEITAKRQRELRKRKANSQSDLDEAESNLSRLKAELARIKGMIARRRIVAPFDGDVGIRHVNKGEMVQPGDKIISLHAREKMYVDFALPQRHVHLLKNGLKVSLSTDAFPKRSFLGEISAVESAVDPVTRNISVQATIENTESLLRAGMFANVNVQLPQKDNVLTIPASSIKYAPYGDTVWKIEPGEGPRPAKPTFVKIGPRRGDMVGILEGLAAGDEVVSSGTFKLRPGVLVIVNNAVQPKSELQPSPEDT